MSGKIITLQPVRHPLPCPGVCYAKNAQKRGCMVSTPGLDLTTSLRGDFQVPLNGATNRNFGAFARPMAPATWAWRRLRGSPWMLKVPVLSPNDHPHPSQKPQQGDMRLSEKVELKNIQVPLNSLTSMKLVKSSPAKRHGEGGGGQPGVPRVRTHDVRRGLGGPYTRKIS